MCMVYECIASCQIVICLKGADNGRWTCTCEGLSITSYRLLLLIRICPNKLYCAAIRASNLADQLIGSSSSGGGVSQQQFEQVFLLCEQDAH